MNMTQREMFIAITNNDKVQQSDAVVMLEGDGENRIQRVAELYKRGFARYVVFSGGTINLSYGSFPYEMLKEKIEFAGILSEHLILETASLHTREQAEKVLEIAVNNKWNSIILVASHYHQYRAFLTFLKVIQEKKLTITIYNAPASDLPWFIPTPWGKRFDLLRSEFEKIEYYIANGQMANYEDAIKYQEWKEQQ